MINDKTIWTFWEPKDKMPGYVKLCIETWKVFFQTIGLLYLTIQICIISYQKIFMMKACMKIFHFQSRQMLLGQRCYIYTVEFGLMLTQLLHLPRLNIFSRILVTFLFFRVTWCA